MNPASIRLRPRWVAASTALAVGLGLTAVGASAQAGEPAAAAAARSTTTGAASPADEHEHDPADEHDHEHGTGRAVSGTAAVERLGDHLDEAAAERGMSPAALERLLESDDGLRVSGSGELYWADEALLRPAPDPERLRSAVEAGEVATGRAPAARSLTAAQATSLHSNPGAEKVIFLDVDGSTETADTIHPDLPAVPVPAWDPADDGPAFSARELAMVERAWAILAERFAPWDVDVTTADPGAAALVRSDLADTRFGARLIVTPSTQIRDVYGPVHGVAVRGFDQVAGPGLAFVFPQAGVAYDPRSIADVGAHEIGHTLGLSHDGVEGNEYYGGVQSEDDWWSPKANWSPIMGTLGTPVVQWSKGEYPGATNTEDDVAVIGATLPLRRDEAPGSARAPADLPTAPAFIDDASDVDSWRLGTCTSGAAVTVAPASPRSGLDLEISLVRSGSETPVATSNPPTSSESFVVLGPDGGPTESYLRAVDLDASLAVPTAGAGYVLQVRGGGTGDWADGDYGPYGSLGSYVVDVTGCDGAAPAAAPGRPVGLTARPGSGPGTVVLDWDAPSGTPTRYDVAVDDRVLSTTQTDLTVDGLRSGATYTVHVSAVGAGGTGRSAAAAFTTAVGVPEAPATVDIAARSRLRVDLRWTPPRWDGGRPVQEYRVYRAGNGAETLVATLPGATTWFGTPDQPAGAWTYRVVAVNDRGAGPAAELGPLALGDVAPPPPTRVSAVARDGSATVTWAGSLGSVTTYEVTPSPGGTPVVVDAAALRAVVPGLADGVDHTFTVTAVGPGGRSAASTASAPVRIGQAPVTADDVPAGAADDRVAVSLAATDDTDEPSEVATRYTVGSADEPAADPRGPAGVVYDGARAPVLIDGQYLRYSSTDSAGNVEQPRTSRTVRVTARVLSAPTMRADTNQVGQLVTVAPVEVSPVGATLGYQWRRRPLAGGAWEDIAGATAAQYRLTTADVAHQVSVAVTARAAGFATGWASSAPSVSIFRATDPGAGDVGRPTTGRFGTSSDPDDTGVTGPADVAVDRAGAVYVADTRTNRVRKFSAAGELLATWARPPAVPHRPYAAGIDVGPNGHVYVVDANNRRVLEHDPDGAVVRQWRVPLSTSLRYPDQPLEIAVDDDGYVYVADGPAGPVLKYDPRGELVARLGSGGPGDGQYFIPLGMVVVDDTVYLADYYNKRVVGLDSTTGATRGTWDGRSTGGEAFTGPQGIATDADGSFYVLDHQRLQKFDADFDFVSAHPLSAWGGTDVSSGVGLDVGPNGQVYVADPQAETVLMLAREDVPAAPTEVRAVPGSGSAVLSWSAPAPPLTALGQVRSYEITTWWVTDSGVVRGPISEVPGDATTATIGNLSGRFRYYFTVKATNYAGDSTASAGSNTISVTVDAVQAGAVRLSATPRVGVRVSAVPGTWSPGDVDLGYRWSVGSTVVSTASSYTPRAADRGRSLTLVVTGTRAGYQSATATASGVVQAGTLAVPRLAATGRYVVGGTVRVVTTGRWSPTPRVTYQWFASGRAIRGATRSTFRLTRAQARRAVTVRVTATSPGYTTVVRTVRGGVVR